MLRLWVISVTSLKDNEVDQSDYSMTVAQLFSFPWGRRLVCWLLVIKGSEPLPRAPSDSANPLVCSCHLGPLHCHKDFRAIKPAVSCNCSCCLPVKYTIFLCSTEFAYFWDLWSMSNQLGVLLLPAIFHEVGVLCCLVSHFPLAMSSSLNSSPVRSFNNPRVPPF